MQKHNSDTIKTSEHTSLENYTSHFIRKGYERYYLWELSWRLNRTATYWHPLQQHFFPVLLGRSIRDLGAQPQLGHGSHSSTFLQLADFLSHPGYIIVRHPPTSCERHNYTQFNPLTIKVIHWYLRPDAPIIY